MTPQEYYRLTGPTELAGPPELYSPTSLAAIRKCPARWQLEHSQWGDLTRHPGTPNRKRVAGAIQHQILEAMFRQMGRFGRPERGTPNFREAMRELDVRALMARLLKEAETAWMDHPRFKGSPLALDPGDLRTKAFSLFRHSYTPAKGPAGTGAGGAGSGPLGPEVKVEDTELRLTGRIDLARPHELVEFKTGAFSPDHERQLELYGLVWSRDRGVNPQLTLAYPGENRSWRLDEAGLSRVEADLREEVKTNDGLLAQQAPARPGDHCRYCPVRAFCDTYWEEPLPQDMELVVSEAPGPFAVGDGSVLVGLHASHVAVAGPIELGTQVRLLGVKTEKGEVTLPPWGELFLRAE